MRKTNERVQQKQSLSRLLWANVVRYQYLNGISDQQLCELLGITTRTLLNYKQDPSVITMRQLQSIVDNFGIAPDALLKV